MKDMTVEELIEIVSRKLMFDAEYYFKAQAHLLRRYEVLQERLDIACHVKADDKVKFDFEILDKIGRLETENESLKCCGNCKAESQSCYFTEGDRIRKHPKGHYCSHWQSDNLTRAERSK